jgi:hypothetical protein
VPTDLFVHDALSRRLSTWVTALWIVPEQPRYGDRRTKESTRRNLRRVDSSVLTCLGASSLVASAPAGQVRR